MTQIDIAIEKTINILREAKHVVVLTGAGISTPSGIPDFRSPSSGLWEHDDPMEVANIQTFKRSPERFFNWIRPLFKSMLLAAPNAAHLALAQMESNGVVNAVITQNIDTLHTKAGSQNIYEVHGHMRDSTCLHCYTVYPAEASADTILEREEIPHCPSCGGVLKPNIIMFGEMLPVRVLNGAKREVQKCDVIIAIGSSLEVAPVGDLPLLAKSMGAKFILINLGKTYIDRMADVLIHADVVDVLPRLAAAFHPLPE